MASWTFQLAIRHQAVSDRVYGQVAAIIRTDDTSMRWLAPVMELEDVLPAPLEAVAPLDGAVVAPDALPDADEDARVPVTSTLWPACCDRSCVLLSRM
jgi:hypothetical protein